MQRLMFDFQAGLRPFEEVEPVSIGRLAIAAPVAAGTVLRGERPRPPQGDLRQRPAIFWGSLVAIPYAVFASIKRRDWRAGFVVVTVLALYLPWFLSSHLESCSTRARSRRSWSWPGVRAEIDVGVHDVRGREGGPPLLPVAVAFVVIAVGLFIFFWPTLTAGGLADNAYRLRTWFPSWR